MVVVEAPYQIPMLVLSPINQGGQHIENHNMGLTVLTPLYDGLKPRGGDIDLENANLEGVVSTQLN